MSARFVVVAKRDCPTCDLVQPVLREIAASGAELTVYTQDDPAFPEGLAPVDDRSLEQSWRLRYRDGAHSHFASSTAPKPSAPWAGTAASGIG